MLKASKQVVAEELAQLALDVATTLATRQVNLIRTQRAFAAAHPCYQLQQIKVVKCNPVTGATNAAIATIKGSYAVLGLSGYDGGPSHSRRPESLCGDLLPARVSR